MLQLSYDLSPAPHCVQRVIYIRMSLFRTAEFLMMVLDEEVKCRQCLNYKDAKFAKSCLKEQLILI